ncbi:hypothetical protein [Streptomyces sp. 8L]|uniref:hypothetical protein n=1 Tax=Streptomyces sp. 8L TaxID=2877242 RepID=UPI001CD43A92|nr:hypothetical protein [Streptomyces sp. 8L]MCA1220255.1 hypothetical protein [Streptomyces sp. 8L]
MSEQPVGPILDGLDTTIELEEGDFVMSALVIAKVVDSEGEVSLALSTSGSLSWIDQNGLLASAQQILTQREIGLRGDDA